MSIDNRIKKLLIANRGEIALRIQRTAETLGLECAITVSEADRATYFAKNAKEICTLRGKTAAQSYLDIEQVLAAATKAGCDAIHPGYGFLSENSDFARAVIRAGMIFIGPRPECMDLLGNKVAARKIATSARISLLPGSEALSLSEKETIILAKKIGYPLIIKAALGGGGRGMRVVNSEKALLEQIQLARAEAQKNFGDGTIFIEKYIPRPRHIEVQIIGDNHGNLIHLGTRECSVQRRHQKLIEEAPAPLSDVKLLERLTTAALKIGQKVNYNNAGTVEFLVDDTNFYFLEMNTRIQVEHPVTEAISGVDLIALQIIAAAGSKLPISQRQVKLKGHAIEFRICAEDPAANFAPATGPIGRITRVVGDSIREDFGLAEGDRITPYYDGLVSKLIITGNTRKDAIARSRAALSRYRLEDLSNNVSFHRWILEQRAFLSSEWDVGFLDREYSERCSKEVETFKEKDIHHKSSADGRTLAIEARQYYSRRFNYPYTIRIVHCDDGTFLLSACNGSAESNKEKYMRRSNFLSTALQSLVEEVLEQVPPQTVLAN